VLVLVCTLACEEPLEKPSGEIVGAWRTDAPSHRDRTFEIREDALVFGTGRYAPRRLHILIGVERRPPAAHWDVYRIRYREYDGTTGEIEIHHRSGARPELRFANRPEVWTRRDKGESDDV